MGKPVPLVTNSAAVKPLGERNRRFLYVLHGVVGSDANSRLIAGRHAPTVALAHDRPFDPNVERIAGTVVVGMDLKPT